MKYPLKLIEWEDAFNGDHDWFKFHELPDTLTPYLVQTLGFEILRDDKRVTLAMSVTNRDQMCDLFTIPVALIVREKTISPKFRTSLGDIT